MPFVIFYFFGYMCEPMIRPWPKKPNTKSAATIMVSTMSMCEWIMLGWVVISMKMNTNVGRPMAAYMMAMMSCGFML